ncbi:MAG: hypothetical protein II565_10230 [Fibrobacter sp.]|nr:hypothetical protein [Fibrobacter sp.]
MAKKKKFWKSPSAEAAFRGKEDRLRKTLCEIVNGQSRLLHRPDELYEAIANGLDEIEKIKDVKVQLELLAWTLRTDFLAFKAEDDEMDTWNDLFYDAGTFFVEVAKTYDDKDYIADLIHDLAVRHVGGEGRSVVFLSIEDVMPVERAKALIEELLGVIDATELENREDVLDAICDMADAIKDTENFAKASLYKDPDKSNATLIDIANSYFVAGDIPMAKQWLHDVKDPGAEDEEAFLDLQAAIADREGRKADCLKYATRLYECFPKVMNLSRLCMLKDDASVDKLLFDHIRYRDSGTCDTSLMMLLANLKKFDLLESYVNHYERDLPGLDASELNAISDEVERAGNAALAKHIREWTVEEPEDAEPLDDRE